LKTEKKAGGPVTARFGDYKGFRGLAIVMLHDLK
jgi:hypothetical protein